MLSETIIIGQMKGNFEMPNRVYDQKGCAPSIQTYQGGGRQLKVISINKVLNPEDDGTCRTIKAQYHKSAPANFVRRDSFGSTGVMNTTTGNSDNWRDWCFNIDGEDRLVRIRKITPIECWRLMGFSDDDFNKARQVNSNKQLYKQAGNSICVPVLEAIFKELF